MRDYTCDVRATTLGTSVSHEAEGSPPLMTEADASRESTGRGNHIRQILLVVLALNLTAPYDKTTLGDTQQSKDRFITEVFDEVKDFPPVVDGKRAMPPHP